MQALRHDLHGVNQRHGVPAQGPQPEIVGKTGDLVTPERLSGIVIGVVVKSVPGIPHQFIHVGKLAAAVLTVQSVLVGESILHIEGLRHVKSVQPYLVGINLLVPEVAGGGAGLAFQLAVYGVDGLPVFFLASQFI